MAKKVQIDETELAELRAKAEMAELEKPQMPNQSLTDELAKLNRQVVGSQAQIPYRIIDDHKNIFLYTGSNHRVGPLHPNNARETMMRWAQAGVQLYVTKRTDAQVAEFKKSKAWLDFEEKNRIRREKNKDKDLGKEFEKFARIIAKESGKSVKEMNQITHDKSLIGV